MSPEDVQADRAAIAAATPGPWTWDGPLCGVFGGPSEDEDAPWIVSDASEPDAEFIARARTRWPAALDDIDALRAEATGFRKERDFLRKILAMLVSVVDELDVELTASQREVRARSNHLAHIKGDAWIGES